MMFHYIIYQSYHQCHCLHNLTCSHFNNNHADNNSFKRYFFNPTQKRFALKNVNSDNIINININFENKPHSSGFDNICNELLKSIKNQILHPLTLIIYQSLMTSIFPDDKIKNIAIVQKGR